MAELRAVPDRQDPDVYGHIDFFDGVKTHRLSIAEYHGGSLDDYPEDIILSRACQRVLRHPYDVPRESTEEERAAVGWTW